jgi:hypothetical protein
MNSASRGLRPTVGLRRPKSPLCVGAGRRPARQRLGRPISIQRSAHEFGLQPSADGRPAPTEKARSASAKADARRISALEGRFQSARKPPATSGQFGLRWPPVGLHDRIGEGRRPARHSKADFNPRKGHLRPTARSLRRPTPGAQRPRRPISIGSSAAVGLEKARSAAEADARRAAPWKADFNRHKSLRPTVGLRRPERPSSAFARSGLPSRTVDASGKTRGGPPEGPATPSTGGCRGSGHSSSSSSSSTFFPRPMTSTSGASAGSGASSMASAAGAVTSAISSSGSLTMVTPGGA